MCDKELAYRGIDRSSYITMYDRECKKENPEYEEHLKRNLAKGWEIDPAAEEGHFRRKWDKRAYDGLALEPVFLEGNSVIWYTATWTWNPLPAIAISKFYPDYVFEYSESSEGRMLCHVLLKNGKTIRKLLLKDKKET